MPYIYKSILRNFTYSTEKYKIVSDFLLDGLKSNPDILLNVTKISKHFGKRPNDWFANPTTISFISKLINIKLETGDKKLEKKILSWLKSESIDENIFDKRINFRVFQKNQNKQLLKLLKKVGMIEVKKGGGDLSFKGT
jgi:hypothetical protein